MNVKGFRKESGYLWRGYNKKHLEALELPFGQVAVASAACIFIIIIQILCLIVTVLLLDLNVLSTSQTGRYNL